MAAGLGFKDFVTGEVLTAADVDGYLMQGVWVFASAAARDAAVTSPQEGNFAYLKDTNVTTYYTGSAWANLDTTGMTNPMTTTGDLIYSSPGSTPVRLGIGTANQVLTVNSGATAPEWKTPAGGGGKVLQVVNGSTNTAVNITSTTQTDTGLTATITPTLNTSKILVLVNQTVAVERASGNNTGTRNALLRNSTVIGGTATSRALSLGDIGGASAVYFTGIVAYSILDAPATTSAITYKTQGSCPAGPGADTVNFQPASIVSSIVLLEIGA